MENTASSSEFQPATAEQTVDYALLAQKSQLRTEEKWIEEALSTIKQQWNSLQIERLQLESNLAALRSGTAGSSYNPTLPATDNEAVVIQNTEPSNLDNLDTVPNCESLNLNVPVYSYNTDALNSFALMEEEEEEEDFDDVNLDICMLMTQDEDK